MEMKENNLNENDEDNNKDRIKVKSLDMDVNIIKFCNIIRIDQTFNEPKNLQFIFKTYYQNLFVAFYFGGSSPYMCRYLRVIP